MDGDQANARTPPLRANLLGETRIVVGARAIPEEAWPRRGARGLPLLQLATSSHILPRDRVLDLPWSDLGPEAALNALYKALHALRRTLEPELRAGRQSSYVAVSTSNVRLLPHPGFWVDVDAIGTRRRPGVYPLVDQTIVEARDILGADAFADHWNAGRALEPAQATVQALHDVD